MTLFNMYYPCKCGTRHVRTEDGNKKLTPDMMFHTCVSCGANVELGDVSEVIIDL